MATSATLSFGPAFEAGEKDIMNRPPRKANLHVMDRYAIWRVVFVGLMIAISAFVLEAASAARLFGGIYPHRAAANHGHCAVVLHAQLPR